MAEAFARAHGSDILKPQSAGLAPAMAVVSQTHRTMLEKKIELGNCFPKELEHVQGDIDLIVNMSGRELPGYKGTPQEVWAIQDPIGQSEEVFRQVRDEIEQRVLDLIERLRSSQPARRENTSEKERVDTRRRRTRQ
jgi:arsenate reductase